MGFRYERAWRIPLGVDELWASLEPTDQYSQWWSWLREASLPALTTGATASFSVAPPLPYHLDIRVHLVDVVPPCRIDTTVSGDLVGWASLSLRGDGPNASVAGLRWDLDLARPALRRLSTIARPVLEWGHEMVVRAAVAGFATAHGLDPGDLVPVAGPDELDGRRSPRRVVADGLWAGALAGIVSGVPSTLAAMARRRSLLESTRAAGTLLGAPTLPRALLAHGAVSLGWGVVLSAALPSPARLGFGVAAGAAIATLDLRVIAPRRFPAVAALVQGPQFADHLLYGAVVAAVLGWRAASSAPVRGPDGRLAP